jgi:nicotinate-nucleotide adenylyltransferase
MTSRRIGILGGTFDPIHCGHIDLARAAERTLELTAVAIVPLNVPPHRPQPVESSYHRFAMVAMTVAGNRGWCASDLELTANAPSYTSTTLRWFHGQGFAPAELFFIAGADAFAEIDTWKDYPDILGYAHFVVVSRPRHPVAELSDRLPGLAARMARAPIDFDRGPGIILIDAETADVSSTAIRTLRAHGKSITGLVHPDVQQHIEQHGLYTSPGDGRRREIVAADRAAGRLHGEG